MIEKGMVGKSYFDNSNFLNVYFSTIIALFNYFTENIFPNDPSRIIYASNDYAFRRRLELNSRDNVSEFQIQSLNMPFMNFAIDASGIDQNTDRTWKSFPLELHGVMDWTIGKKIRMSPVRISFESTFFSDKDVDIQYIISKLFWDNALETIIKPEIEIDGQSFYNMGLLSAYEAQYRPQYNENDWLERNKIRTIPMNFAVDTFLLQTDTEHFWIPKEVLFSFASTQNLDTHEWTDYDLLLKGVINHIENTVVF